MILFSKNRIRMNINNEIRNNVSDTTRYAFYYTKEDGRVNQYISKVWEEMNERYAEE